MPANVQQAQWQNVMLQLQTHLDAGDDKRYTALMYAAARFQDPAVAALLLQNGASILLTATDCMDAFKLAMEAGNLKCAEAIFKAAQDRDSELHSRFLETCYDFPGAACTAAAKDQAEALKMLASIGININKRIRSCQGGGFNAMHRACEVSRTPLYTHPICDICLSRHLLHCCGTSEVHSQSICICVLAIFF